MGYYFDGGEYSMGYHFDTEKTDLEHIVEEGEANIEPPVMPTLRDKFYSDMDRKEEILEAMQKATVRGFPIPEEWAEEFMLLNKATQVPLKGFEPKNKL